MKKTGRFEKKHGMCDTSEYKSWKAMKERMSPNHKDAKHYYLKGVTLCDRWKNDFMAFYEDMGPKPTPKHTIDRIDNDKGYEPSNCRWASKSEQGRNKRHNITVEINGEKVYLKDYAKVIGVDYATLGERFRKGKRGDELFAPPDPKKQRPKQPLQTVQIDGKTMSFKEAALYKGINIATVRSRKSKGLPPEMWFVSDMKYKHGKYAK